MGAAGRKIITVPPRGVCAKKSGRKRSPLWGVGSGGRARTEEWKKKKGGTATKRKSNVGKNYSFAARHSETGVKSRGGGEGGVKGREEALDDKEVVRVGPQGGA